ncbi:hypothetical protein, partial [Ethanoligenens sp.]|uniref:hypothetical protein n=1 Tax=Ethanoligenens sp. TaxID=2099655 RepID=UPI0039EA475B
MQTTIHKRPVKVLSAIVAAVVALASFSLPALADSTGVNTIASTSLPPSYYYKNTLFYNNDMYVFSVNTSTQTADLIRYSKGTGTQYAQLSDTTLTSSSGGNMTVSSVAGYGVDASGNLYYYDSSKNVYEFNITTGVEKEQWTVAALTSLDMSQYRVMNMVATGSGFAFLLRSTATDTTTNAYDYPVYTFDSSGTLQYSSANVAPDLPSSASYHIGAMPNGAFCLFYYLGANSGTVYALKNDLSRNSAEDTAYSFSDYATILGARPADDGKGLLLGYYENTPNQAGFAEFPYGTDAVNTQITLTGTVDTSAHIGPAYILSDSTGELTISEFYRDASSNPYVAVYQPGTLSAPVIPPYPGSDIALPTNTTPTNSTTQWQTAGTFTNTNFAFSGVTHAGSYDYLLQKDGSKVKMVRYADQTGTGNVYPVDSSYGFDLTDATGTVLDFSSQKISGFAVLPDGASLVWVKAPPTVNGHYQFDNLYFYDQTGKCTNVIVNDHQNDAAYYMVYGVRATVDGKFGILQMAAGNQTNYGIYVYNENNTGSGARLIDGTGIAGFMSATTASVPLISSVDSFLGMNGSGSFGFAERAVVQYEGTNQIAKYSTAVSIDNALDTSSARIVNFPTTSDTIDGVIPTSNGAMVMTQSSDNTTIKVNEYNNYTGSQTNPSIWNTSFKPQGTTSASILAGTETDPAVYSFGTDGQTIYVEGLQGSQTVKNGTPDPAITIGKYSDSPTDQDVTVTATVENGTFADGTTTASHTFSTNGSYTFTATNAVGELASQTVNITNIDKTPPTITLGQYNSTTPTNQDITVTASTDADATLNATTHTFTQNGSFTFTATDALGHTTNQTVTITNIDKTAPVITIGAYSTDPTSQEISVTATTDEGTFADSKVATSTHTFTQNGSYTFTATDAAGNTTTKTVTISNIIPNSNTQPLTDIDAPADGSTVSGTVNV